MDTIPGIVLQISFGSGQSGQPNQPTGDHSYLISQLTYSGVSGVAGIDVGALLSGLITSILP